MKIAIVYDWIDKWGGVERVLLSLHDIFPDSMFFTSYYDKKNAPWAKELSITTSFINQTPSFIKSNRVISLPLYPLAFEAFDFKEFDVVLSVTSSFAKGIITQPHTKHICFLLTPTRYLWLYPDLYLKNNVTKILAKPLFNHLKKWDLVAANRPDSIISISKTVQQRTKEIYGRNSSVIYPPFDVRYWSDIKNKAQLRHPEFISELVPNLFRESSSNKMPNQVRHDILSKYFLVVSRLEPYKKVDLVISVFNKMTDKSLIIVGQGSEKNRLQNMASKNIIFMTQITDTDLATLYNRAEGLIMPQEEDFGFISLEAQFFGCPVIAYKKGGAVETIIDEKTGIFFDEQSVSSLEKALHMYDRMKETLKKTTEDLGLESVKRFSKKVFERKMRQLVSIE